MEFAHLVPSFRCLTIVLGFLLSFLHFDGVGNPYYLQVRHPVTLKDVPTAKPRLAEPLQFDP